MCGIHVTISPSNPPPLGQDLERRLRNRGPDRLGTVHARLHDAPCPLTLTLTSTVLSLRGDHIAKQPLIDDETGSALCWNGEVWRIGGETLKTSSDTEAVFELLLDASRRGFVLEALRAIEGPFAFTYFDKPSKCLYYGRDRLGRRSLLVKAGDHLTLSSIAESPSDDWIEVEADGCYKVDLGRAQSLHQMTPSRHAWVDDDSLVSGIGVFNTSLPTKPSRLCQDSLSVRQLHQHLIKSLETRVQDIPLPPGASNSDARLAVLFSGGLDCTVLARITSEILPSGQPIDLINVAFENPRIASQHRGHSREELYELCPDRITGRKSFAELLKTCPGRLWRFVTVNVPYTETSAHRGEIIHLIHPHNTEMDLSIANALYFAARGDGSALVAADSCPQPYQTTARVLLSGLGADELFGGYGRHGVAFSRNGYAGLMDELRLDVSRLGKRNLGRDDRVVAHWGREVRFPFLDERLVKWAVELPAWEKCDFGSPAPGDCNLDAEKRVLRLLAQSLGMPSVAEEKKRAIQFGARTAKMKSGKVKGTTSISL